MMTQGPVLRPMCAEDLPVCVEIYVAAYQAPPYEGCFDDALAERILAELFARWPETCFVAESANAVVGFVCCSTLAGIKAVVEEFAVTPAEQGHGIGAALFAHALAQLKAAGHVAVELVALRDAPAYQFYLHRGFGESRRFRLLTRKL